MESKRISIEKIQDLAYDGYIWMSDQEKPKVCENEKVEWPTGANPFIVEGQLYNQEKGISYSIKFVDGKYIINEYEVKKADLDNEHNEQIVYHSNKMDGRKLKFLRYWEEKEDVNCMNMPVLTLTKTVFIGFTEKKKEDKKKEDKKKEEKKDEEPKEEKPAKKPKNPLDLLPPSKLELEVFKRAFLNNKDKEDAMKKFWEVYDPEGYSLWHLEYQNLPTECKVLFRTSNSKSMFLQKCDALRRYAFAAHGVYGVEDDYKIKGVWLFRGLEVPQEMKDNDLYEYITFRKLDTNNEADRQLVHDYWTKLDENDEVEGRKCADVSYFN